jgi:hypothetical protein
MSFAHAFKAEVPALGFFGTCQLVVIQNETGPLDHKTLRVLLTEVMERTEEQSIILLFTKMEARNVSSNAQRSVRGEKLQASKMKSDQAFLGTRGFRLLFFSIPTMKSQGRGRRTL